MADNTALSTIQRGCAFDLEVTSIDPERCPSDEQCPKCHMCRAHCKSGQQGGCGEYLSYRRYKFNRESHPTVSPQQWKYVFHPAEVDRYEARYLAELGICNDKPYPTEPHSAMLWLNSATIHTRDIEAMEILMSAYRASYFEAWQEECPWRAA